MEQTQATTFIGLTITLIIFVHLVGSYGLYVLTGSRVSFIPTARYYLMGDIVKNITIGKYKITNTGWLAVGLSFTSHLIFIPYIGYVLYVFGLTDFTYMVYAGMAIYLVGYVCFLGFAYYFFREISNRPWHPVIMTIAFGRLAFWYYVFLNRNQGRGYR